MSTAKRRRPFASPRKISARDMRKAYEGDKVLPTLEYFDAMSHKIVSWGTIKRRSKRHA